MLVRRRRVLKRIGTKRFTDELKMAEFYLRIVWALWASWRL
jgi:hypothetical protein